MSQELLIFALRIGILVLLYLFLAQIAALILKDLKSPATREASAKSQDALVVLDGDVAGLVAGDVVPLETVNSLGRAPGNSIRLVDDFVSAQHAILDHKGKAWWVEDMGSTNGTFVNGKQITKPTKVVPGDVIQVGTSKLRLGKR